MRKVWWTEPKRRSKRIDTISLSFYKDDSVNSAVLGGDENTKDCVELVKERIINIFFLSYSRELMG